MRVRSSEPIVKNEDVLDASVFVKSIELLHIRWSTENNVSDEVNHEEKKREKTAERKDYLQSNQSILSFGRLVDSSVERRALYV